MGGFCTDMDSGTSNLTSGNSVVGCLESVYRLRTYFLCSLDGVARGVDSESRSLFPPPTPVLLPLPLLLLPPFFSGLSKRLLELGGDTAAADIVVVIEAEEEVPPGDENKNASLLVMGRAEVVMRGVVASEGIGLRPEEALGVPPKEAVGVRDERGRVGEGVRPLRPGTGCSTRGGLP